MATAGFSFPGNTLRARSTSSRGASVAVASGRSLRDAERLRRTAWSLSIASVQHAILVAWIASLGSIATAPPPRLVVSLAALSAGNSLAPSGGAPMAQGGGASGANPARTTATIAPVPLPPIETKTAPPPKPADVKPARPAKDVPAKPSPQASPAGDATSANPATSGAATGEGAAGASAAGARGVSKSGAGSGDGEGSYRARLVAWLARHKRYPARARAMGLEGDVALTLTIARDGRVHARAAGSAKYAVFAREAEEMVDRASPFPAVPSALEGERFEFQIPVQFRLAE